VCGILRKFALEDVTTPFKMAEDLEMTYYVADFELSTPLPENPNSTDQTTFYFYKVR
jgi:hypothetical protein